MEYIKEDLTFQERKRKWKLERIAKKENKKKEKRVKLGNKNI